MRKSKVSDKLILVAANEICDINILFFFWSKFGYELYINNVLLISLAFSNGKNIYQIFIIRTKTTI